MITRRSMLTTSAVLVGTGSIGQPVFAQQSSTCQAVERWSFTPPEPFSEDQSNTPTGTGSPRNSEVTTAFKILFDSPRNVEPFKVAEYFASIEQKNSDGNLYKAEWPVSGRANPVIVGFFSMTNTLPSEGDQTSWCAAFVNFCLAVSDREITASALSGSFRKYRTATENPKQGDIVVFTAAGERGKQGFGHVGFYVSHDQNGIEVLGGNQRGDTKTTGAVTRVKFPYKGEINFHSFRSSS